MSDRCDVLLTDRPWRTGALLWAVGVAAVRPDWTGVVLLLGGFVIAPLALTVAARLGPDTPALGLVARCAPWVAVPLAVAEAIDHGPLSAVLVVPWIVLSLIAAAWAILRALSRAAWAEPGIASDAAIVMWVVGSTWWAISRAGANPMGFSDEIVRLTAVHFHYAGLALPVVAAAVTATDRAWHWLPHTAAVAVPVTAYGITVGGTTEWVAATLTALAGAAVAVTLLVSATGWTGTPRLLGVTAGTSLLVGMILAAGWAWSMRYGWGYLDIDGMARTHGTLNGLGFGLCGLLAAHRRTEDTDDSTPVGLRPGRPGTLVLATFAEQVRRLPADTYPTPLDDPTASAPHGHRFAHRVAHTTAPLDEVADRIRRLDGHTAAGFATHHDHELTEGAVVVIPFRLGPGTLLGGCRITKIIDEPDRYGFVYATTPAHPEQGDELFLATRTDRGLTRIEIVTRWRYRTLLARLGGPITAHIQRTAIETMLRALAEPRDRQRATSQSA